VPTQALFLMNNPFVIQQAQALAQRLVKDSTLSDAGRVDLAYKLAFTRMPTAPERTRAMSYIESQMHATPVAGSHHDSVSIKVDAWASFCQALFASAEFRYTN